MLANLPLPLRRRLRFGVRGVIVLMVLVAVPLAWKVNRVRAQRQAIAAIVVGGGSCAYDYQVPDRQVTSWEERTPPEPRWLRSFFGDDFFSSVVYACYDEAGSPHAPALLPSIPEVSNLVVLSGTDASLDSIGRLSELNNLNLNGEFSGGGLARLGSLKKLKMLTLYTSTLDQEQIESLATLKTLESLVVLSDRLTDAKLENLLDRLPNVRAVTVSSNQITHRSLDYLGKRQNLFWISADGALLTDEGCNRLIRAAPPECMLELPANPPGPGHGIHHQWSDVRP